MDILVRFWCEDSHKVVTKYLTSFFFGRATVADIVKKIMVYQEKSKLSFESLFNISFDGSNINEVMWSRLNATFVEGKLRNQHMTFVIGLKIIPCKTEDFKRSCECVIISYESLFLWPVST